jgi:hypothetical protein
VPKTALATSKISFFSVLTAFCKDDFALAEKISYILNDKNVNHEWRKDYENQEFAITDTPIVVFDVDIIVVYKNVGTLVAR